MKGLTSWKEMPGSYHMQRKAFIAAPPKAVVITALLVLIIFASVFGFFHPCPGTITEW